MRPSARGPQQDEEGEIMGQILRLSVELVSEDCGKCGGTFAINSTYRKKCYDDGKQMFACPYCKTEWGWTGRGALQLAQKALAAEQERHRLTLARENEERAEKELLARKLMRVNKGVCPKCNRTFANLARHMECKHKAAPK